MLSTQAKRELKINQRRILIDSIEIGVPSPEQILLWGKRQLPNGQIVGQVKNSKTVNYKKFIPLRDGLFCERIFGPITSLVCACGKRQPSAQITFCEKCEVEYTDQRSRRYRLGYIPLVSSVAHIWYLKGRPSYLSLFLGKRKKRVVSLAYCNAYLVEQAFSSVKMPFQLLERENHGIEEHTEQIKGLTRIRYFSDHFYNSTLINPQLNSDLLLNINKAQDDRKVRQRLEARPLPRMPSNSHNKERYLYERKHFRKTNLILTASTLKDIVQKNNTHLKTILSTDISRIINTNLESSLSKEKLSSYKNQIQITNFQRLESRSNTPFSLDRTKSRSTQLDQTLSDPFSESTTVNAPVLQKLKESNKTEESFILNADLHLPGGTPAKGRSVYTRAQTLPFLPSLVCKYNLRDELLDFLNSSPWDEDMPIPLYCSVSRWHPLRDVHKFMAEQPFRHFDNSQKTEKLSIQKESSKVLTRNGEQEDPFSNNKKANYIVSGTQQSTTKNGLVRCLAIKESTVSLRKSLLTMFLKSTRSFKRDHSAIALRSSNFLQLHLDTLLTQFSVQFDVNHPETTPQNENSISSAALNSNLKSVLEGLRSKLFLEGSKGTNFLIPGRKSALIRTALSGSFPLTNRLTGVNQISSPGYETYFNRSTPSQKAAIRAHQKKSTSSNNVSSSPSFYMPNQSRRDWFGQLRGDNFLNGKEGYQLLAELGTSTKNLNRKISINSSNSVNHSIEEKVKVDEKRLVNTVYNLLEKDKQELLKSNQASKNALLSPFLIVPQSHHFIHLENTFFPLSKVSPINSTNIFNKTQEKTHFRESTSQQVGDNLESIRNSDIPGRNKSTIVATAFQLDKGSLELPEQGSEKLKHIQRAEKRKNIFLDQSSEKLKKGINRDLHDDHSLSKSSVQIQFPNGRSQMLFKSGIHLNVLTHNLLRSHPVDQSLIQSYSVFENTSDKANLSLDSPTFSRPISDLSSSTSYPDVSTSSKTEEIIRQDNPSSSPATSSFHPQSQFSSSSPKSPENSMRSKATETDFEFTEKGRSAENLWTSMDQVKAKKKRGKNKEADLLAPLELVAIREILSYTGGGALERLLQRFDTKLFSKFLLADIQAARSIYKKIITVVNNSPNKKEKKALTRLCRRIYRNARRLKIAQLFARNHRRPEWMMISTLPVLPPDLRPILQMSESLVVASDLNNLYQRVIYRNNRYHKLRFIDFNLVTAIQRLIQDAVDRLIENGKGGSKPFYTSTGRPLKSLSDTLKGKKGRFRLNLLGKRVDFSGRSVIVVSPNLKIHECGLPREIALELYHYFLLRQFMLKKQASSIVMAKKLIKERKPAMWDMLRDIIYHHPILLNRAPTLHRLGIQAFQPRLVLGSAILLHPLVCSAFNADFDGDQMGIHLPLCLQARAEAWDLLWSRNNLLSPATGQPMLVPSQDMVLGFYYMTALFTPPSLQRKRHYSNNGVDPLILSNIGRKDEYDSRQLNPRATPSGGKVLFTEGKVALPDKRGLANAGKPAEVVGLAHLALRSIFLSRFEVVCQFQKGQIGLHTPIWLKWNGRVENDEKGETPLELRVNTFGGSTQIYSKYKKQSDKNTGSSALYVRTTAGRVLVNDIIFSTHASKKIAR